MPAGTKRAKARRQSRNSAFDLPQGARGLWIDRDLLRRHMNPVPKAVLRDAPVTEHKVNRYLELADTLLKQNDQQDNSG